MLLSKNSINIIILTNSASKLYKRKKIQKLITAFEKLFLLLVNLTLVSSFGPSRRSKRNIKPSFNSFSKVDIFKRRLLQYIVGTLTLCLLGHFACNLADIFKKQNKNLSEALSECQTVWIHFKTDILSGLIRVQIVCKVYQQTTIFATITKELTRKKQTQQNKRKENK